VPAHVREGASSAYLEAYDDEDDASPSSGATVLVVIGFVVVLVVAGVIWLRRNKATAKPGYEPTMGAMTRWSCGHEATLSRPLDPGVTVAKAPCPFCGRVGIVGQYVGTRFLSISS
jgi:hypothetical protein